ncbi:MAG: desulfoferrodoxin [Thermodesulfobacteriota bacterium]
MAERFQIYKCELCGNIVEVMFGSDGTLVCCDQPMTLMKENTVDASKEKHVPVIEKSGDRITVKVGSVAHPMEEKHYIQWIELIADGKSYTQFLKPGDVPQAVFVMTASKFTAREYCNIHGQWKAEL